jgi:hypothetical protein
MILKGLLKSLKTWYQTRVLGRKSEKTSWVSSPCSSKPPKKFCRMLRETNDVFILNGCVYWRYVWSEFTVSPGVLKETFSDGFWKMDYKANTKVDISCGEFRKAYALFQDVKNDPEFVDTLFGDVLESIWLTKILYQSEVMTFGQ